MHPFIKTLIILPPVRCMCIEVTRTLSIDWDHGREATRGSYVYQTWREVTHSYVVVEQLMKIFRV